ncbi:Cysteine dioxygenase [Lachnellula hyalina]|uniref:Cysteine dioxygenase n=1 Tax=Lachnellula hyalina TaxID=1316788 RepID=A0A8H8U0V1_9HELO|nr:Cysteine dioxygenase [Lachnellula hyalina]TVY26381.1 Cysteine dioxygenase [Lachnellula hyalina]
MVSALAGGAMGAGGSFAGNSRDQPDAFQTLVADLSRLLGPSSGIDSADVNVGELKKLMEDYVSCEEDWAKYAFSDHSRGYTRNLVDKGNGKSNLLVLVWSPGKGSPIHDHANAHCLMKVLKGSLKESRYSIPADADHETATAGAPVCLSEKVYGVGQVAYMADELGVHRISNPDEMGVAVSLHLYTPPNAAKAGCNIFNENTGAKSHVQQNNFFSEFGVKI